MAVVTSLASASVPKIKRPPLRLYLFVLFAILDAFIFVAAIVTALTLIGLMPTIFDSSKAYVEVWGSRYTLDQPTYPWVVGILSAMSFASAWFVAHGRHFPFVLAVALAWVALGIAAIATGSGAGLLILRIVLTLLLFSSRGWFGR